MKILFVWTGVTSYMADCWRKLQQPGVELKVVVEQMASGKEFVAEKVLAGLDYALVSNTETLRHGVLELTPDVIFAVGWHSKVVREVVTRTAWKDVPKVCCFDLPWRWQFRCLAAKFVLWPFLHHYDAAYVPGKACARYAKWLGFKRIDRGLFSIDVGRFSNREAKGPRADFLYVGRFAPEKHLDVMLKAFARYRELGGAWSLDLYGSGALPDFAQTSDFAHALHVHSFVQAAEMPRIYHEHACLLLTSDFDPWPLVALEAKASGCEVIQSDRCGNRFELNTRVVKFGDVEALARKMLKVEREVKVRGEGEQRKVDLSLSASTSGLGLMSYDCHAWAKRTLGIAEDLMHE